MDGLIGPILFDLEVGHKVHAERLDGRVFGTVMGNQIIEAIGGYQIVGGHLITPLAHAKTNLAIFIVFLHLEGDGLFLLDRLMDRVDRIEDFVGFVPGDLIGF